MNRSIYLSAALASALAVSCGGPDFGGLPPATLSASNSSTWARASAPNMWAYGIFPLFAGMSVGTMADPACPVRTVNGSETTLSGGCTDMSGRTFSGTVHATGLSSSGTTNSVPTGATYDHWTVTQMCMGQMSSFTADGSFTSTPAGDVTNFQVRLTLTGSGVDISTSSMSGCMVSSGSSTSNRVVVDYSGSYTGTTVSFGSTAPPSTWNGSGRFGTTQLGVLSTTTHDELLNQMTCQYTPLSGTTTITAGSDTAVITYQGASTCDMMASAAWTLNGAAQPNLTGVSCSVTGPIGARRGVSGGLAALAALAAVSAARKRRNRKV